MSNDDPIEQVLREVSRVAVQAEIEDSLAGDGWRVDSARDPARGECLRARKGRGEVTITAGRDGSWVTRVAQLVTARPSAPPVWRVDAGPAVPVDVVRCIAAMAAHDPDDLGLDDPGLSTLR